MFLNFDSFTQPMIPMWARACDFVRRCWRGQWWGQALIALAGLIAAYLLIILWQFFLGVVLVLLGLWLYNHYFRS
jgi:hypothetical protein